MVRLPHNGYGDNGASEGSADDQNNHFVHYLVIIGQEDKKRCNVCMVMHGGTFCNDGSHSIFRGGLEN